MDMEKEKENENECLIHESVEDNDGIANDSISGSRVKSNGSCAVENSGKIEQLNLEVAEGSGHGELKPKEITPTRKGVGLKKWRRIRRDANRDGENNNHSYDSGNMEAHEAPHSGAKPSKRAQYADMKQKSEGSVSSTNAVVRNFDGFSPLDDYNLGLSPAFAAGTDSENSEDRSSKSSTAASAPKIKYEISGFPRDKSKMSSSNGKSSIHSGGQFSHHGKGRAETGKKARGERVKIEKENSHSSVESDSRSSNFVFVQGSFFKNNGMRNEYDGENGDEAQNQVNHGHQDGYGKDGEGGFEDLSAEDGVADSSWANKEERSENHGSMRGEKDPLAESMLALLSVQEALQEEVNKFKEIGNDVSVDGPVSDLSNEYVDVEEKLQETSGEGSSSQVVEAVAELEDIFKQKIEAEVEYLTISRTVQNLRVAAVDQMSVLEQTKVLDKVEDNENKAAALAKKAEKLENFCEELANSNKKIKLQKEAFKYGSCFLMQSVLLFVVLSFFIHQFSQDYVEVVPT